MAVILRLIAMGVPAAKIIAKYGEKAYKAAKKAHKTIKKMPTRNKVANLIAAGVWLAPAGIIGISQHIKKKKKEKEKRLGKDITHPGKEKKYYSNKAGGTIKTYAKGSIVRKPKY